MNQFLSEILFPDTFKMQKRRHPTIIIFRISFRNMHPIKPKGLSLGLGFQFFEYLG